MRRRVRAHPHRHHRADDLALQARRLDRRRAPTPAVCQGLAFSYGVHPIDCAEEPDNWRDFAARWLREHQLPGHIAMLVAGPSTRNPDANHRIEFLRIDEAR